MESSSKHKLLNNLQNLVSQIDDYFDLDPHVVQKDFILRLQGNGYNIINKNEERANNKRNFLEGIQSRFEDVTASFFVVWDNLQNNPELDLCIVTDALCNSKIYQVYKFGLKLRCVSLSKQELDCITLHSADFHKALETKGLTQADFEKFIEWQKRVAGPKDEFDEQVRRLKWNGCIYHNKHSTLEAFTGKKRPNVYASYCKFFTKFGFCNNINCKFTHDPRHVAICKEFYLKGTCHYGKSCSLKHSITGDEYTVPHCKYYLEEKCSFDYGAEENFGEQDQNLKECCKYVHLSQLNNEYPMCRQFSHTGFCYRGTHCKFLHLWQCPDDYTYGYCILQNCKYVHHNMQQGTVAKSLVPLEDISANGYLLPPVFGLKKEAVPGVWYGLRSTKQSINITSRKDTTVSQGIAAPMNTVMMESSEEEDSEEEGSGSETSGSYFSESESERRGSNDELDADFISLE